MNNRQSAQQFQRGDVQDQTGMNGGHRRLFLWHVVLLLVLICTLPLEELRAQEKDKRRTVLFGVPLIRKANSLLEEVEQTLDKHVREEWVYEKEAQCGNSWVDDDGTPVIQINPVCGRNGETVVHELYHFKMRIEGYPILHWLYPTTLDTEANRAAFKQLAQQMHDPILHYLFYSKVRSWGINPGKAFETLTKQGLQNNTLANKFSTMDKRAVALYWFKVQLEVNDRVLKQALETVLERKEKRSGIDLGNQLAGIVMNSNLQSPEEEIKALVECLNIFYQGSFHFKQRTWTSKQLGKHRQQVAQIELEPLR